MATVTELEAPHGALITRPFRVLRTRQETADTWTLALAPVAGPALGIEPGQFSMLYAFGVGEVPISTSGDASRSELVHTVRAVGAVTNRLCAMRPDDVVGVRGPYGNTWPVGLAQGADVVVVAGGVGLAPLRPLVYHLLAHRSRYGDVALLVGGRSPRELLFRDELEQWRADGRIAVDVSVDAADASWHGKVGLVTKLIPAARFDPDSTVAFVCGPELMMRFSALALADAGVDPWSIHVSLERTMRCGVGLCGHCQLGPTLVCRDGPVYAYPEVAELMEVRDL